MRYRFVIHGHANILSTHKSTIEFTKDTALGKEGNCIVGVGADFDAQELKKFAGAEKVKIIISNSGGSVAVRAVPNPLFSDERELVIRKGSFASARTFAVHADKAAADLPRGIVAALAAGEGATVTIES